MSGQNMSESRTSASQHKSEVIRRRVQDDRNAGTTPFTPLQAPHSFLVQEGYTSQKYRVGCPPLQILPLETTLIDYDNETYVAIRGYMDVFTLALTTRGVQLNGDDPIEFVYRKIEGQTLAPQHMTLAVKALWNDGCTQQWLDAADALRGTLRSNPMTSSVRVEIIAWQLTRARITEPLEEAHPIVYAWPGIRHQLLDILCQSPFVKDSWQTIVVLRRGYVIPRDWDDWSDEPDPTSVALLIVMSYDVDPWQWYGLEHSIEQLLLEHDMSAVQVEIERGANVRSVFALGPPTIESEEPGDVIRGPYSFSVGLGADCGPARDFEQGRGQPIPGPYGTIGGLVTLSGADGTHKKMAVLNYHVARDVFRGTSFATAADGSAIRAEVPDESEVDFIDRNGMAGTQNRKDMLLESPSRRKHNYTMQELANTIATIQVELNAATDPAHVQDAQSRLTREQEKYNNKKQFFDDDKQSLGRPWLASGFTRRTSYNARKEKVFKVGARTGLTACKKSALMADCRFPNDGRLGLKPSSEHCFVRSIIQSSATAPVYCGQKGDSGAFVWTRNGMLMGQLFGGLQTETLTPGSVSYVTDAEELLESMNQSVGGGYKISLATD
ncbi:MAG: hypothetical protein Q9199_005589 [Rusavskia elegans]